MPFACISQEAYGGRSLKPGDKQTAGLPLPSIAPTPPPYPAVSFTSATGCLPAAVTALPGINVWRVSQLVSAKVCTPKGFCCGIIKQEGDNSDLEVTGL